MFWLKLKWQFITVLTVLVVVSLSFCFSLFSFLQFIFFIHQIYNYYLYMFFYIYIYIYVWFTLSCWSSWFCTVLLWLAYWNICILFFLFCFYWIWLCCTIALGYLSERSAESLRSSAKQITIEIRSTIMFLILQKWGSIYFERLLALTFNSAVQKSLVAVSFILESKFSFHFSSFFYLYIYIFLMFFRLYNV